MKTKKTVAVIFGGQSSEHEVSRLSAQSVIENIDTDKYNVIMIGITKDGKWLRYEGPAEHIGTGEWQDIAEKQMLESFEKNNIKDKKKDSLNGTQNTIKNMLFNLSHNCSVNESIDVVFPVLHGCNGEDGTIQVVFELAGRPYVGPGVLASSLGMDKAYSKIIFEKAGIPQGKYLVFSRKQIKEYNDSIAKQVEEVLGYPCFVKPSNAGSSVGVSKVSGRSELASALELAARYDRKILVEEFINGREIECAVLGNDEPEASTAGEIVPCNEFYDYNAKYEQGDNSRIIIPADLPEDTIKAIREYAVRAFKALDCAGLSRVDFFVHKETGKIYINEINTLPGFTCISMYPKLWEASGLSYGKLIERLIELAEERYKDNLKSIN